MQTRQICTKDTVTCFKDYYMFKNIAYAFISYVPMYLLVEHERQWQNNIVADSCKINIMCSGWWLECQVKAVI